MEGGQSFAEQCDVIKWLEEAGVDFFDISGGTYATPAWRGNVMPELTDRPSQRERGRYVCFENFESSRNAKLASPYRGRKLLTRFQFSSYFIEWAQELKKVLVSRLPDF